MDAAAPESRGNESTLAGGQAMEALLVSAERAPQAVVGPIQEPEAGKGEETAEEVLEEKGEAMEQLTEPASGELPVEMDAPLPEPREVTPPTLQPTSPLVWTASPASPSTVLTPSPMAMLSHAMTAE